MVYHMVFAVNIIRQCTEKNIIKFTASLSFYVTINMCILKKISCFLEKSITCQNPLQSTKPHVSPVHVL